MIVNCSMECPSPPVPENDTAFLVIRCYDAVIRDLEQAGALQRLGRTEETFERVRHAQDVITELLLGLDYERGGEVARNLGLIYNFLLEELIAVDGEAPPQVFDPMIQILTELKSSWEQIRLAAC